ncbi:NPR2-domain-containing protein [Panus rudis PR-1116 ss-1]|nr:NPR2-domain-containing protein [Panus rudis PR-1116 ss-1]
MAEGEPSFLPRIESVFYAVFDVQQGSKIVHQVPEGLIYSSSGSTASSACNTSSASASNLLSPSPSVHTPRKRDSEQSRARAQSRAQDSPHTPHSEPKPPPISPNKRGDPASRFLFNFDDVSKYIIPPSALCGRLVSYATKRHRILGFPVELRGRYERNYFRFNLCFAFGRSADLSCFEPIVRKVARVLTACEEESAFLSSPQNSTAIHAILEQLYEDLNSYAETSIPIDQFNSIELKILPFYPNPPPVKDWQVPLALINLKGRIKSNWDLTISKVCQYIDGVNHVARIASLAECDIVLCREAISHLLYYQVIMMIDIFQFSNMYTLRKNIQWLAEEPHVTEECGPYVLRPGALVDWPRLLYLYSRLKPGKTVFQWMQEYDVHKSGIDPRRFISFGVIKGFLQRVHRWPILLQSESPVAMEQSYELPLSSATTRQRGQTFSSLPPQPVSSARPEPDQSRARARIQEAMPTITSAGAELVSPTDSVSQFVRRSGVAEVSLERLRSGSVDTGSGKASDKNRPATTRTGRFRIPYLTKEPTRRPLPDFGAYTGLNTPAPPSFVSSSPQFSSLRMSPDALAESMDSEHSSGGRSTLGVSRPRITKSPSAPTQHLPHTASPFPPNLIPLLDGEHHTDELCTKFNVGWPMLSQWLMLAGGGQEEGDYGNICVIA